MICTDRRALLLAASGLMTLGAARPRSFTARLNLALGLQLYTLGAEIRDNFEAVLAALAAIGFREVETAGLLGRTPAQFRKALDAAGLTCTSAHIQAGGDGAEPTFASDPGRLADMLQTIGATHAVLPLPKMPDRLSPAVGETGLGFLRRALSALSAEDWRANAAFLNSRAADLKPLGVTTAYHNHNVEFRPLAQAGGGPATGYEILLQATDPDLVVFELDAGWAAAAGVDVLALLQRYPGRFKLMHVKDIKASTRANFALAQDPTEVGSGVIDWSKLLPAAYTAGVRHFFIEQEPPFNRPRLESLRMSFDHLDRLGGGD